MPNRIVACFDLKVATESFASESENKFYVLSDSVVAMIAERPARAQELAFRYVEHLAKPENELTALNITEILRAPIRKFKHDIADAYVSRRLGISYQDFHDHGLAWFGQATVDKYRETIESNPLGVEMIIAGFVRQEPFLCELRNGEVDRVSNFCLIGTGAYTAEPALHSRGHLPNTDLQQTIYQVFEAKKAGEASPYVGQRTRLFVLAPPPPFEGGKMQIEVLTLKGLKELDRRFRKFGPRKIDKYKPLADDDFIPAH